MFRSPDASVACRTVDGKCGYCGASQKTFDRGEDLETQAYAFIHSENIKRRMAELFGGDMQFDVIIGNPPYQLNDGGYGTSAAPIYQMFVEKALDLDPRYALFVTPSRWWRAAMWTEEHRRIYRREGDGAGLALDKMRRRFPWLELIWADGGYNTWQVDAAVAKVPWLRMEIVKQNDNMKDFENLAETLATFVTFASIQFALRRLVRA